MRDVFSNEDCSSSAVSWSVCPVGDVVWDSKGVVGFEESFLKEEDGDGKV